MQQSSDIRNTIRQSKKFKYQLVLDGFLVGIFSGAITILYRFLVDASSGLLADIFEYLKQHPLTIILWCCVVILMAFLVSILLRYEPLISGGGIPHIEGELRGPINAKWIKVILAKFTGGIITIFAGLSVGRAGPSIQMGALSGKGISRILKRTKTEEKYLITCGMSAGVAATFNAPLSGVMFALEVVHRSFSPLVLIPAMVASIAADFLSRNIFGLDAVFRFEVSAFLPLSAYWSILILGIILGLAGSFYNRFLLLIISVYEKIGSVFLRTLIPFLIAVPLGFLLPQVLGGGNEMFGLILDGQMVLSAMAILLIVKVVFSLMSFGSGAPGGIFFPMLTIGAYIGAVYAYIMIHFFGIDQQLFVNFMMIAMAGYFAAMIRAPITGIVLITEMTGTFHHLLSLVLVVVIAYFTAELLRSKPIYDSLYIRLLGKKGISIEEENEEKVMIEIVVHEGSSFCGKQVREVEWPDTCLLVSIKRGRRELIPKGNTVIEAGDMITAIANESDVPQTQEFLNQICHAKHITFDS